MFSLCFQVQRFVVCWVSFIKDDFFFFILSCFYLTAIDSQETALVFFFGMHSAIASLWAVTVFSFVTGSKSLECFVKSIKHVSHRYRILLLTSEDQIYHETLLHLCILSIYLSVCVQNSRVDCYMRGEIPNSKPKVLCSRESVTLGHHSVKSSLLICLHHKANHLYQTSLAELLSL